MTRLDEIRRGVVRVESGQEIQRCPTCDTQNVWMCYCVSTHMLKSLVAEILTTDNFNQWMVENFHVVAIHHRNEWMLMCQDTGGIWSTNDMNEWIEMSAESGNPKILHMALTCEVEKLPLYIIRCMLSEFQATTSA